MLKNTSNNKSLKQEAESIFNKLCKEWMKAGVSEGKFVFIPVGSSLNGKMLHESAVFAINEKTELEGNNVVSTKVVKIGNCGNIDNFLEYVYENGFEYDIAGETFTNDFTIPFIVTVS